MKAFLSTTVFRIIILLGGRIYMTNYQSDSLYNFLKISNPATNAVLNCYSGVESINSGINSKLEMILNKLENKDINENITVSSGNVLTGTLNKIFYATGSIKN